MKRGEGGEGGGEGGKVSFLPFPHPIAILLAPFDSPSSFETARKRLLRRLGWLKQSN